MNTPAERYSPNAVQHDFILDSISDAEKHHARTWAALPEFQRADLIRATGIQAKPSDPYLMLNPSDRDALRDYAVSLLSYSARLGGFLA